MRTGFIFILILQTLVIYSCGNSGKKEKAEQYYSSFLEAIRPYKLGTESVLKETKEILEQRVQSTGEIKLSTQDSLKVVKLFVDFQSLTEKTKLRLNELRPFDEFNLKTSALEFVDKNSKAISGSYREIIFPFQDKRTEMSQKKLESLIAKFTTDLNDANRSFTNKQREFLHEFRIPANN